MFLHQSLTNTVGSDREPLKVLEENSDTHLSSLRERWVGEQEDGGQRDGLRRKPVSEVRGTGGGR